MSQKAKWEEFSVLEWIFIAGLLGLIFMISFIVDVKGKGGRKPSDTTP